jgi:hypothetical protein
MTQKVTKIDRRSRFAVACPLLELIPADGFYEWRTNVGRLHVWQDCLYEFTRYGVFS